MEDPETVDTPRSSAAQEEANATLHAEHGHHLVDHPPWLDEQGDPRPDWSQWRINLAKVVMSAIFVDSMLAVIVCNMVIVIYETDQEASCYPTYKDELADCPSAPLKKTWLRIINLAFLILYSFEAAAMIFTFRKEYFYQFENWFDLGICVVGWVSEAFQGFRVSWLRIWRLTRLTRNPRMMSIPEFHMLVSGFKGSMRAIGFGAGFLFAGLVTSSIVVVQYVHPTNVEIDYGLCSRCPRGFETVMSSSLTLYQQIVAGDSWGLLSIPNMENNLVATLLLPIVHIAIGLGIMNLILAVIVDRAVEAREAKREDALRKRMREMAERKRNMIRVFEELDLDGNGGLDIDEVGSAYKNSVEFKKMMMHADIQQQDLEEVFNFLDADGNGEISYSEFCNALDDVTQRETKVICALTQMKVENMRRSIGASMRQLAKDSRNSFETLDRKLDILLEHAGSARPGWCPAQYMTEKGADNIVKTPRDPLGGDRPHKAVNGEHSDELGHTPRIPVPSQSLQALRFRMEQHVCRFQEEEANHIQNISHQLNRILSDVEAAVLGKDINSIAAGVWSVPSANFAGYSPRHPPETPPESPNTRTRLLATSPRPAARRGLPSAIGAIGTDRPVIDIELN